MKNGTVITRPFSRTLTTVEETVVIKHPTNDKFILAEVYQIKGTEVSVHWSNGYEGTSRHEDQIKEIAINDNDSDETYPLIKSQWGKVLEMLNNGDRISFMVITIGVTEYAAIDL